MKKIKNIAENRHVSVVNTKGEIVRPYCQTWIDLTPPSREQVVTRDETTGNADTTDVIPRIREHILPVPTGAHK